MFGFFKSKNSIWRTLLVFLCSTVCTLLLPLIGSVFGSIYLFRWIVAKSAKILRPDLGKILSCRSAIFGADKIYDEPESALILSAFLEGPVDVSNILNDLKYKILDPSSPVGGLQNPELKMYVTSWCGFLFWKPEANFRVEDHLDVYDDLDQITGLKDIGEITGDNFNKIANRMGLRGKPFTRKRSPWEFLVFRPIKRGGNGFLMLRVHHALADGFSLLKRFVALNGIPFQVELPKSAHVSKVKKFAYCLAFPILAPYQLIHQRLCCQDLNEFHPPASKMSKKIISGNTSSFSTDYIKSIRKVQKCSFTAIILAAITGGIRKYMIENQIKVPDRIHCMTVLPMVGHPNKLRNHMTACFVKLPLGISDPLKRIKKISQDIETLKRSTFPLTLFSLFKIIGGLFTSMAHILRKNDFATAILANIPGPPEGNIDLFGHKCQEVGFTGGLHGSNISLSFTCVSLSGKIRIAAHIDQAVIPSQGMMNDLMDKIMEEFDILGRETNI